jgi:SsrA-binding protein
MRNIKLIAQNKNASFNYFIEETFQAGIELTGTEVKSLRNSRCNIKDSFVRIKNGEAFIINMHISAYEHGNIFNTDPLRTRKLLLHKYEINKLQKAMQLQGYSIIPIKIYFESSLAKIDIAIAKGKKLFDKRDDIAKKDMRRDAQRNFKISNLYIK